MSEKTAAAVILCAGKGTRMNDANTNKVCFDCAGVPVIRRIVLNMKEGGVGRFVIVAGYQAQQVMDALDGIPGIVYVYQKEQRGTGHAAMCGVRALIEMGADGPVIVSMGDKIIAPHVIADLLAKAETADAVWGIQPLSANPNGGRVVVRGGKPYGVVEFADAALTALHGVAPERYAETLRKLGLNAKKAEKVCAAALKKEPEETRTLCGEKFGADEILYAPFANAGLYCFDTRSIFEVLGGLGSDNAQGEIYLTDALEAFAKRDAAVLYEIDDPADMLTYSTKTELAEMSVHFLRSVSEIEKMVAAGAYDGEFRRLYRNEIDTQRERYIRLLRLFRETYGDKKVLITRAPGRVNLMGRHIDHRGGGINVMAIDRDTVLVAAPRRDDTVNAVNTDPAYPKGMFSIEEDASIAGKCGWMEYLEDERVKAALAESRGSWLNYLKAALIRARFAYGDRINGMDIAADGNIPAASGLSSSSSVVVAAMEAVSAVNCLNFTQKEFIDLCGEGEWFVGSRGGAGDHAAMKAGQAGRIVHLGFKPFHVGESAAFSDRYAVIVANSMIRAKKSEGSRDKFNEKVASYELAFLLLKQAFPDNDWREFRDLAAVRPYSQLYRMLKVLPEAATRKQLSEHLPGQAESFFATHADPGTYDLRGVCLFGISECARSEACIRVLERGDYRALGEMMRVSHDGDRVKAFAVTDAYLEALAESEKEFASVSGNYGCSVKEIDGICDLLDETDGVLGSELVGAGLGGCVIALVESDKAAAVIEKLNREYYDKHGYPHGACVCPASCGSSRIY